LGSFGTYLNSSDLINGTSFLQTWTPLISPVAFIPPALRSSLTFLSFYSQHHQPPRHLQRVQQHHPRRDHSRHRPPG
jgi:hypothetical protein